MSREATPMPIPTSPIPTSPTAATVPTVDQAGTEKDGGDQLPLDGYHSPEIPPLTEEDLRFLEDFMAPGDVPPLEDTTDHEGSGTEREEPPRKAVLDIKPFIPDLVPIGVDFRRIRDPRDFPLYDPPGYYQIRLKGSKENQPYSVKIWVTPTTTAGDLLSYLSDNFGYQPATVRLLYCGERLKATDTMTSIEMEPEGDIDVAVEMMGG